MFKQRMIDRIDRMIDDLFRRFPIRFIFLCCLLTLVGGISTLMVFLWTKFCMLFLMWSSRRNEFTADEYAYNLGYGTMLASVLDRAIAERPTQGLLKALYASHPSNDDRVAHLQELGANYSRY